MEARNITHLLKKLTRMYRMLMMTNEYNQSKHTIMETYETYDNSTETYDNGTSKNLVCEKEKINALI